VLVAIFGDKDCEAVSLLNEQGITSEGRVAHIPPSAPRSSDKFEELASKESSAQRLTDIEQKLDAALVAIQDLAGELKQLTKRLDSKD